MPVRIGFPKAVVRDLARSGLTTADARQLRIETHNQRYRIPYFELDGQVNGFYRDRLIGLPLPTDKRGKSVRYTQPPNEPPRIYFPPLGVQWEKVTADSAIDLVITEGEKKAACACKAGIPALGLGGVWNWRSKSQPIADLDLLKWIGRRVNIVFDSDARENINVQAARWALSAELRKRGAVPSSIELPLLDGQKKTGLDDFILAKGAKAFRRLLQGPPSIHIAGAGAAVLDCVHEFLGRFIVYPSEHEHVAHTLWIAHTHLLEAWESTPRLAFLAPERSSGKTRALELTETLVPRPVNVMNATVSYIFRKISDPDGPPTILYDEIDTLFGPQAKGNEEIRGLVNAGHRRGASVGRTVALGNNFVTEELPVFCAVALAGIGNLPDTILSRSVVIRMQRRAPGEKIEPYRRQHAAEGNRLRDKLAKWAEQVRSRVNNAPDMPAGIEDRDADVWEALLAVADAAGGDWRARANVSAVSLVSLSKTESPSLGVKLLTDLKQIFGDNEKLATQFVLDGLNRLEESPWANLKGEPLDAHRLARLLAPYGVKSKQIRIGLQTTCKGYTAESLFDAWKRYVPVEPLLGSKGKQAKQGKQRIQIRKPGIRITGKKKFRLSSPDGAGQHVNGPEAQA